MAQKIRHVLTILAVEDVQQSAAFYQHAFDWRPDVEAPVYVEFTLEGGQRIGLYERDNFGVTVGHSPARIPKGKLAPTELYFYPDDLEAAIDGLRAAGARQLSALSLRAWGDEAAYFADPSGNVLVLARPT